MALQEDRNIRRITIVGGGTTGYITAFYLAKTYPQSEITWIYPAENNAIGVGEALVPKVSHFLNNLGITHQDIITHCNGTLKLGLVFDGFDTPGETFTFPFGIGEHDTYNSTSVNYIMKQDRIPDSMFNYPDISTHFRTTDLCAYMDTLVHQFANLHIQRTTVTKEELSGTYDLLVDCTGFKRNISNIPNNFKDLSHIVPNNKAYVFRHAYTDRPTQQKPYSIFKAMDYGWIWHIPLGDQIAMGYVHDSKYDVKAEFIKYVEDKLNITVDPDKVGSVNYTTGRNHIHMKDNVVAVGLASSFIEPLESTGLYLVVSALEKLTSYIDGSMSEQEYNESTNADFDVVVDFIIAHYKFSKRRNPYWDSYKNTEIKLYQEIDIFPKQGWDYILNGFDKTVKLPVEHMDPRELINIHRGTPYYEWIQDESNFTQVS